MTTPWSTDVDTSGDNVIISVMASFDPGPMRIFRPFLEMHAVELFGKLALALRSIRDRREAA